MSFELIQNSKLIILSKVKVLLSLGPGMSGFKFNFTIMDKTVFLFRKIWYKNVALI